MPVALRVHAESVPQRRFVDTPSRVPLWQLLHREADKLYPELRTVWEALFRDVQAAIDLDALQADLATGNLLVVENLLSALWQQHVDGPARTALPVLIRETVAQTAVAALPEAAAVTPELLAVQFNVAAPEVLAVITNYVGTEIQGISQRSLLAVRGVIRQGFSEGRGVQALARDLRQFLGLTQRQVQALTAMRARLRAAGVGARQVEQQVARAARLALQRRAVLVARSESIWAASAGQHQLWVAADRQGVWDHTRLRRRWLITFDDRLCPNCRRIPQLNPGGVPLHEPFQTPYGPVLHAPAHPA